jgi:hypothetical protein
MPFDLTSFGEGDCASVVIQLAQDLSLRFEMTDHFSVSFRAHREKSFFTARSIQTAPPPALIDLTAVSGRNRLRIHIDDEYVRRGLCQIVGADNTP